MSVFCVAFILFAGGFAQAVDTPLPVAVQYQVLRRVLSFDRNLRSRSGAGIVLGIAYVRDIAYSTAVKDDFVKIVRETKPADIEGLAILAVPIEFTTPREFTAGLASAGVNLLYIAPVAEGDLKAIIPICASKKIPTVAGLAPYVNAGVAVVLRQEGGRLDIVVNQHACRTQGFNFSARLLHLARIYDGGDGRAGFRP